MKYLYSQCYLFLLFSINFPWTTFGPGLVLEEQCTAVVKRKNEKQKGP